MSHDQGDGLVSTLSGGALALAAHASNWVIASTWAGEVLHTVVFGLVGGAAGFAGKRLVEHWTTKKQRTKNDR
jgi:hypothetical protein